MTDPADSQLERVAFLRRLDQLPSELRWRYFDPAARTIDGRQLSDEEGDMLLACTVDDLYVLTDELNQDAALRNELAEVTNAYADMLRPQIERGARGAEEAISRMSVDDRREARRLQNRRRDLQRMLGLPED